MQEGTQEWNGLYLPFLVRDPQVGPLSDLVKGGNYLYAMLKGGHCMGHNSIL